MSLAEKLQTVWIRLAYKYGFLFWLCRKFKPAKIWCDEERKTFNIMNGRDLGNYLAKNNLLSFWDGKNIVIPFGWTLKIGHSCLDLREATLSEGVRHG